MFIGRFGDAGVVCARALPAVHPAPINNARTLRHTRM
jgi:hypothetical protein